MDELLKGAIVTLVFLCGVASPLYGGQESIGPSGINAASLNLTGNGIDIGQVEDFRPGKTGFDTDAMCCNTTIVPTGVFVRDMDAGMNASIDEHAIWVAGVMISTDVTAHGVAPGASLYSSADAALPNDQSSAAIAAQHVALTSNARAINMSFGKLLDSGVTLNGNSLLTLFLDWSASSFQHDVLYVVAGNDGSTRYVPTDNYNGMTVSASRKEDDGVFRRVSPLLNDFSMNADAVGSRTSTDILAPGFQIELTGPNGVVPTSPDDSGTSFAAPHATGTVALLQEHAENQIMNVGAPRWTANARRHEVMKAVLMNSADKLQDAGDGARLGMTRTVLKQNGTDTWLNSNAFTDDTIPLDIQMGTGHLNAKRAFQQFDPGEYDAGGAPVPAVGWDLGFTDGFGDIQEYSLAAAIPAGQFVSLTLAWDREVFFENDGGTPGVFDVGDTFMEFVEPLDLNLYLMPAGETNLNNAAASSIADGTSVEHIFFEVDSPGMYEIWVEQAGGSVFQTQDYALAWWMAAIPLSPTEQGDYSDNGTVGPEDYDVWVANFGSTTLLAADGNGNGVVDAADYTVWRDHLGLVLGGGAGGTPAEFVAVPEPAAVALWAIGSALVIVRR